MRAHFGPADIIRIRRFTPLAGEGRKHPAEIIDAPNHFIEGGGGIEALELDVLAGPARVIQIADPHRITAEELRRGDLAGLTRILIRTRRSPAGESWASLRFDLRPWFQNSHWEWYNYWGRARNSGNYTKFIFPDSRNKTGNAR